MSRMTLHASVVCDALNMAERKKKCLFGTCARSSQLFSVFQVLLELLLTELCPELRAHLEQLNAT